MGPWSIMHTSFSELLSSPTYKVKVSGSPYVKCVCVDFTTHAPLNTGCLCTRFHSNRRVGFCYRAVWVLEGGLKFYLSVPAGQYGWACCTVDMETMVMGERGIVMRCVISYENSRDTKYMEEVGGGERLPELHFSILRQKLA